MRYEMDINYEAKFTHKQNKRDFFLNKTLKVAFRTLFIFSLKARREPKSICLASRI